MILFSVTSTQSLGDNQLTDGLQDLKQLCSHTSDDWEVAKQTTCSWLLLEAGVPSPPGRLRVISCDGSGLQQIVFQQAWGKAARLLTV